MRNLSKEIFHFAGKEKRCKKMHLYYKTARVLYDEIPVTLFFSRVGTNGDWKKSFHHRIRRQQMFVEFFRR